LKSTAEIVEIEGRSYRVISLEDLIVAKEALGRPRDVLTARELRVIAAKRRQT
jgi:hypothetical protein